LLSSVRFGSLLVYSPQGQGEGSVTSRRTRDQIKRAAPRYLNRVAELIPQHEFVAAMFGNDVVLVPTPGAAPLHKGAIWTPYELCKVMLAHGLAAQVAPWLSRAYAVPKSATALPEDRPRARDHYESMAVNTQGALQPPGRIVIVDDFVTRGATFVGSCSRIAEVFPDADVTAFAAVRTMTGVEIDKLVEPTIGEIRLQSNGETFRAP
jgi:hypothetical protein